MLKIKASISYDFRGYDVRFFVRSEVFSFSFSFSSLSPSFFFFLTNVKRELPKILKIYQG